MICGRRGATCWDRKERCAALENSCSQVQVDFDAQCVQLSLSQRGFASKYEEKKRAGFVVDSTRAWPLRLVAGVEGVRLSCRLQVE